MIESASARPPLLLRITDSQPPTPSSFATTIVNSPLKFSLGRERKVACMQHQRSLQLCTFFGALLEFHLSKYHSIARRVEFSSRERKWRNFSSHRNTGLIFKGLQRGNYGFFVAQIRRLKCLFSPW